jgi:hypothetical protein
MMHDFTPFQAMSVLAVDSKVGGELLKAAEL